jgi:hypothetical protein
MLNPKIEEKAPKLFSLGGPISTFYALADINSNAKQVTNSRGMT